MSTTPERDRTRYSREVRAAGLTLLLAALVCFIFAWGRIPDAPINASAAAQEAWYLVDRIFNGALYAVGVAFLLAAGLSLSGRRVAIFVALVAEILFALLMFGMAANAFLEGRAIGQADMLALAVFLILMIFGISGARFSYRLYRATRTVEQRGTHASAEPPA